MGIAYCLGKKIIIIVKKGTIIKETAIRTANQIITYEKLEDIKEFV